MRFIITAVTIALLSACSGTTPLSPALTARMDTPGAQLNRVEALNIINQYRATKGAPPLREDAALTGEAQKLAAQYASTGKGPKKPDSADAMRLSAGYASLAETFSGWRSTNADASALIAPEHTSAGIGVAYSANSTYGVHWVLLLKK